VRAFGAGKAAAIPAFAAAITSFGPETRNIGAAIAGIFNRSLKESHAEGI
jgi:hypothetical protein